jgi:protocatechuate 3,4-dioxygenase beta subunit
MHIQGLAVGTNTPGRFEIPALPPGRKYGLYVSAQGYGQKFVNTIESSEESKRVELDPVELKPANFKLAGQVVDADDKPVAGAYVNLNGEGQPNGNSRTDREGRFSFNHVCEGSVQLSANVRNSQGSTSAEAGDTNVVLKLGEMTRNYNGGATARKLKGIVTGPDGKPVAGVQVAVFPFPSSKARTATNGAFSLHWSIQPWQSESGGEPCLVVRDIARNLAAAEDISEDTTNFDVRLQPAWTVTGRVEGVSGAPLTNAQVGVWLLAGRTYNQLEEQPAKTDARGNFALKALPPGPKYIVYASAKGHGRVQQELDADTATNRVELPAFVLRVADKLIAGQVVNAQDKPVSGVNVSLSGDGQPETYATTDSKGHFSVKVCDGEIRLFASGQNGYANTSVEAGDTNIVLALSTSGMAEMRPSPKRFSLIGKPLPDLTAFGLSANAAPEGRPLLLCLLDADQRPSRRIARLLADQCPSLSQQGVTVLAIQAVPTSAETLQTWTNSTPMPFALGCVAEKNAATRWATDVESLPWFILRDAGGRVTAEGFSLEELDAKLAAVKKAAK